jgi:phospholipid/cholesterol/gamma-HCH transport system ATP-binding protein
MKDKDNVHEDGKILAEGGQQGYDRDGEVPEGPAVSVKGLTARYNEKTIVENVSFDVKRGETFVILGESGCGKSTLLKHMMGLYKPYAGTVSIGGVDINAAETERVNKIRKGIGVLFQSAALFGSMTLKENIELALTEYTDLDEESIDLIVRTKLAMVDLAGYENHLPSEVSGGMKIRAGFARAMALEPWVMFLDEPSAGLDPITAAEIDILIKSISAGLETTMVIITQELESIFNIASRVIILDKDKKGIIARGDPRELKEKSEDSRVANFFNRRPMKQKKVRA